jgi:hypothetical protein
VVAQADEVVVAAVMTTMMMIVAVQAAEAVAAAVMTTMMMIAVAAQVVEAVVAAVMTMMMTIAVVAQADEVVVAAVMTTMIMMAVVKTLVIKNVMPMDALRLKQNVLRIKEALCLLYFYCLLYLLRRGCRPFTISGILNRLTKRFFKNSVVIILSAASLSGFSQIIHSFHLIPHHFQLGGYSKHVAHLHNLKLHHVDFSFRMSPYQKLNLTRMLSVQNLI